MKIYLFRDTVATILDMNYGVLSLSKWRGVCQSA